MSAEADTYRQCVLPKLYRAGWTGGQISQECHFTDGRAIPVGRGHVRKQGKRADYLLSYLCWPKNRVPRMNSESAGRPPLGD